MVHAATYTSSFPKLPPQKLRCAHNKTNTELANVKIEFYNANGNPQRAKELAEIVTRPDVEVILAIATPAARAVARTPSRIPLIYGAVADPKGAGLLPSDRTTGIQNAGPAVIQEAISFIKILDPNVKHIGSLYNPAEQNSVYVQKLMQQACDTNHIILIQRTVADSSEISAMTEDLASQVDVIYSANDNTVNAGVSSLVAVANAKKIPFVIGDLSTLPKGAVAAVGLEYLGMGKSLAEMTAGVLEGKPISQIPPQDTPKPEIWLNASAMQRIGKTVTPELRAVVNKVIN